MSESTRETLAAAISTVVFLAMAVGSSWWVFNAVPDPFQPWAAIFVLAGSGFAWFLLFNWTYRLLGGRGGPYWS